MNSDSSATGIRRHHAPPGLERLIAIALGDDTDQARHVADFLLSWYNAVDNGAWSVTDLWAVDDSVADDIIEVLRFIRTCHCYPDELGYSDELASILRMWRTNTSAR